MNSYRLLAPCVAAVVLAFISAPAFAQVSISLDIAPPPLVVEDQPPAPDDGYIWTPGYWAYDQDQGDYYWVEGSWEQPPEVGLYWTPNYWGWNGNDYVFYPGYWGSTVGFYGGVNYGHGYWGNGYGGGRWNNGHFEYNTAANNVSGGRIHNTYADKSLVRSQSSRVSFNGGKGGIQTKPNAQQQQASRENHVQATAQQQSHFQTASQTRSHQVKVNAHPAAAANAGQPQGQPSPGMRPADAPHTQGNPTGSPQFTGEGAQDQRRDQNVSPTPVQHQSQVSPDNQPKPEVRHDVTNEQHTPVKNVEEPSVNQVRPEATHPEAEVQHAPESHPAQGPTGDVKPHSEAPAGNPHPQAPAQAPHADAKPQGQPAAKSDGQGKSDSHQDNGQH